MVETVASVLQLAELATKTSIQLYDLVSTIRRAPAEIKALNSDVITFNTFISSLTASLNMPEVREIVEHDAQIENSLKMLQAPIESYKDSYARLMKKLKPYLQPDDGSPDASEREREEGNDKGRRASQGLIFKNLTWFFRRREVFPLITELDRAKNTFGGAMAGINLLLTMKKQFPDQGGVERLQHEYREPESIRT